MRAHTHSNPLSFFHRMEPIELRSIFPHFSGTIDLEVGSGMGLFLRQYAAAFPSRSIIGVEVRKKVADIVAERVHADQLTNVHVVYGSAERLIEDALPDGIIDRVFIFHPDPWFKTRHHNRRVVRPSFLKILEPKLTSGARIYLSTDVTILWEAMVPTLTEAGWQPIDDSEFWTTHYQTHWKQFTQSESRSQHFGAFQRK